MTRRIPTVRKAEVPCNICNSGAHLFGEVHLLVIAKFVAPVFSILHSLVSIWNIEEVFPVESRWSLCDSGIELFEMVGGSNHQNSMVTFEAINFIEEVGSDSDIHERIYIFKN